MTIRIHNLQKETKIYKTYNRINNDKKERTKRTSLHCKASLHFTQLHFLIFALHYPLICLNPFTFPTALITFPTALITFPTALITFPAALITFPTALITFPAALITFPASLITFPTALITFPTDLSHISYCSNHISYRSNHISYRSNTLLNKTQHSSPISQLISKIINPFSALKNLSHFTSLHFFPLIL